MFDIAPVFRELIALLPLETINEMEQCLLSYNNKTIQRMITDIRIEKARRK